MRHVSTLRSALRSTLALVLLTLFAFAPMRVWASPASSPITQVTATDSIFEDRVELYWEVSSTDGIARFNISRDGTLIGIAAAGQTSYIDATAAIGTTYTYCVEAVGTGGGSLSNLCDAGTRTFRGATSFTASEDTREDGVLLAWTDNSGIEEGYRVTRTPITQPPAPGPDATFTLAPNTTTFLDDSAVQGSGYIYCAIAYNGTDTAGTVTGSCDVGRRALVTPPASVTATDGIYTDRVVVTWTDQSDTEEAYVVYRDATLLATLGADVATYTDNSAANGSDYTYCVAAVVAGNESSLIPDDVCDTGRAGNLQAPTAVSATYETFDDRIDVTWTYDGPDAVTGFNVYRAGGFITQLAGGARSYSDTEAVEGADHTYCIEAVSSPTDGAESISGQACTATPGRKAFVLPATDLTATEGDFEDQTDLSWASTSTTVMLFNVYRDGSFLATTAADVFAYTDKAGVSDQTYDYCVTAMTVSSATAAMMRQGDLAAAQRAVARYLAEAQAPQQFESTANYKARVVGGVQEVMAAQGVTAGLEESAEICAQGFRSLMPPTNVAASYNDAETHVDVTWTDASSAEKGYRVYRTLPAVEFGGPAEGDRVALMPKEELVSGSAGTVEMWFRIDGTMVAADHQSFLIWGGQSGDGFGGQTEWHLGPTGSELTFFSNETSTVLGGFITQDTWHHTALTWDGTMYRMYLDGVEVASFNGGTPDVTAWSPDILLGRPSQNGRTRFFGGQIRDVRVWNVARTQTEINQNRHTVLSGAEAGLTGLWRFDEGEGSLAANSAGGSAASLVGVEWWVGEGQIAEVSAMRSSFADYTGIPGTVYPYAVRAFDEYLTGAFSESADGSYAVSTETTGSRTLVAPTDVVASDGASETDVTLTWTDASRAETSYEIFRDGALVATLAPNEATYTDTSPTFNVVHTYGVRAIDDYGASATVVDDGFTTILSSGSVSASDTYTGEVIVTWVDVSGVETAYEITRDGTSLATLAAGTTTYTDATAASGATYEYCVVTVSGAEQAEAACDEGGLLMTTTVVSGDGAQMDLVVPTGPATIARLESLVSDDEYMAFGMPNVKQVAIFKRNGEEWEEQVVIGNSVGTTTEFGQGLALDGDYLAISAPEQSNGVIYIYKRTGETWEQQASIDDGGAGFNGYGLSLDGTTLVSHDGSDNVSVYDRSGTAWTRTARFKSGNATGQDATVSISGNLLLVGGWNYPLAAPAGAAYLYQRTGNNWNLVQTLSPAGATSQFGAAVHLEGNHVIVSEPGIAVHTWYWNGSSATNYESVSSPRGSNAFAGRPNGRTTTPYVRDDHMAIADYLIGTNDAQPLIYVYRHINGNWELIEELDPGSDVANNPAAFTISDVTISNGFIFGGSSAGTIENGGIAFVTAYPVQPTTLLASDGLYEDRIQVRWTDANKLEDGFNIYRRDDEGVLQLVGTTGINVTTFNDFSAAPGNAYEYCVTAFISELQAANSPLGESIEQCDAGWRPTNGVIAGQVLGEGGGGTQGAEIAITPAPNHALLLDGAGGYAQAAEEIVLNAGDLTIEFWAKRTTTGTTDHVVTQGTTTRKNQLLLIGFLPNNQFIFGFWANDVKTIETFTDTDWHHWAVTYDRAGDARAIYRDGVSLSITAPNSTGSYAGSGTIYIGKYSSSDFFGGQIDEVRIWDVVRTQAEIRATMSTPLTGSEDNLVAYWPFDQGARGTAPDLTSAAAHAELIGGAHWSDSAAPLAINATTDAAGNYTFSGLRYNEGETFTLTPTLNDRSFSPAFKTITLSTENPVENEVDFIDDTAFTLAGRVLYDNTVCPVADVQLFVDDVAAGSTESDGTFSLTATPSDPVNPTDTRTLTLNAGTGANVHPFSPASFTYVADQDTTGLLFYNQKTFELSGFYGGGTATCSHYVGDLTLKIVTEDGCFEQEVPLTSFGNYNVALPPQEYLVSVSVDPNTIPAGIDAADVIDYFEDLGQMEVNLTTSADTLDVAYRAPLAVTISGFPNVSNSCAVSGYSVVDSGGSALRTLPAVPVIGEYATVPLTIAVVEDYGTSGTCPVTDGTLTIFDSIGDVEDPQEIAVTSGQVN
ncbi:MAG: LamG domain-containing protein [Bacteroidota bacterium]